MPHISTMSLHSYTYRAYQAAVYTAGTSSCIKVLLQFIRKLKYQLVNNIIRAMFKGWRPNEDLTSRRRWLNQYRNVITFFARYISAPILFIAFRSTNYNYPKSTSKNNPKVSSRKCLHAPWCNISEIKFPKDSFQKSRKTSTRSSLWKKLSASINIVYCEVWYGLSECFVRYVLKSSKIKTVGKCSGFS